MARLRTKLNPLCGGIRFSITEVIKPATFKLRAPHHPLHKGCDYILIPTATYSSPPKPSQPTRVLFPKCPKGKRKCRRIGAYPSKP